MRLPTRQDGVENRDKVYPSNPSILEMLGKRKFVYSCKALWHAVRHHVTVCTKAVLSLIEQIF